MAGYELATAYVNLVASSDSIPKSIARGMAAGQKIADKEGKESGKVFAKAFESAKPIDLDDAAKKAAAQVEIAAKKIKDARAGEEAATRKVQIEEAKLVELRESGKAKTSQILATEDRLAKAKGASALASQKVKDATNQHTTALAKADQANAALRDSQKKTEKSTDETARGFAGLKNKIQDAFGGNFKGAFAGLPKEADSAGRKVEKEFDEAGKSSGNALTNGIKTALGAAAAYMSFDAIKGFLTDANDEARESQKVGALTAQVIKSTGGAAKVTAEQVGNLAGAISEKAGMDDEAIQSGANMLLTFKNVRNEVGKGNDVFNRATQAAVDLSAAGFGDVTATSKQLGKALNDPIKGMSALGRSGVTFTKDQQEMIKGMVATGDTLGAQKLMLKEVESQVGGAAAASSTAGEKMAVTWGNFKESVGTAFLPLWDKLFKAMQPVVSEMGEKVGPAVDSVARGFAAVKDNILPLTMVVGSFTALWVAHAVAAWAASAGVTSVGGAFTFLFAAIATGIKSIPVIGWIIAGIGLLVAALTWFFTKTELGQQIWANVWGAIKTAAAAVFTWFQTYVVPVWNTVMNAIGTALNWVWTTILKPVFDALVLFWQTVLAPVLTWLGGVFKAIFTLIGAAIGFWWNTVVKPIFDALVGFWQTVIAPVLNWLKGVFTAIFTFIGAAISLWWNTVLKPVFNALVGFWKNVIAPVLNWLKGVFSAIFSLIGALIKVWWNNVKMVFNAVVSFLRATLGPVFSWLYNNIIKPVWDGIKNTISNVWNNGIKPVFNTLANFIKDKVAPKFKGGVDAIKTAWEGVKEAAKAPIRFVVDTVINKGIVGTFNDIADKFPGTKKMPDLKLPKGFRTGGKVWGPGTETSDSIPARLSKNEHVLTAKDVRNLGGHGSVYALRRAAAQGWTPAFAGGGTLMEAADWWIAKGAKASRHSRFNGGKRITSGHSANSLHYQDKAVDFNFAAGTSAYEQGKFDQYLPEFKQKFPKLRVIWKTTGHWNHLHLDTGKGGDIGNTSGGGNNNADLLDGFLKPFNGLKDKLKEQFGKFGKFGEIVKGMGEKAISAPIEWIKANISKVADFVRETGENVTEGITKGAAWSQGQAWAVARGLSLGEIGDMNWLVSKESSWNPKAQNPRSTASGLPQFINSTSRQYLGGSPAKNFGVWDQLDGMRSYVNDRYDGWGGAVRFWKRKNYYRDGGAVIPKFDNGGLLRRGVQLVNHDKARPDRVLTDRQWNGIYEAAKGGTRGGMNVNLTTPIVERNEVDDWFDKVQFGFTHMAKTQAFSGVNG